MVDNATKPTVQGQTKEDNRAFFIIAYVLEFITGIIVLLIKGNEDKRLRLHSFQAIFLGVIAIVIAVLLGWIPFVNILADLAGLFIWLYGLYIGFEAYNGNDIVIPYITEYAKRYSGYEDKNDKSGPSKK